MHVFTMYVRKHKYVLLFLVLLLSLVAYSLASDHGQTSFFGKQKQDACADDNCELAEESSAATNDEINVIITFTNAKEKPDLHSKFTLTVSSLFAHSSVPVTLFIMGDNSSQEIAKEIIEKTVPDAKKYKLASLNVDEIAKKLEAVVRPMQERFSYKPGAYYSHALFFLSVALHRVMDTSVHRAIMLDADLKFMGDIAQLYGLFDQFDPTHLIGIANDAQPVYRHTFWQYRNEHKGTRVGEPPPNGLTGFNSGVLLLNLDRMRSSELYNSLLSADAISRLSEEFHFKGHLGDQDFFTLVGMRYEELFYVLPCVWNRQLCTWWKDHGGYSDVFDLYYRCPGTVMIYHGNCNTPIP